MGQTIHAGEFSNGIGLDGGWTLSSSEKALPELAQELGRDSEIGGDLILGNPQSQTRIESAKLVVPLCCCPSHAAHETPLKREERVLSQRSEEAIANRNPRPKQGPTRFVDDQEIRGFDRVDSQGRGLLQQQAFYVGDPPALRREVQHAFTPVRLAEIHAQATADDKASEGAAENVLTKKLRYVDYLISSIRHAIGSRIGQAVQQQLKELDLTYVEDL
jgi:hypothetical protein